MRFSEGQYCEDLKFLDSHNSNFFNNRSQGTTPKIGDLQWTMMLPHMGYIGMHGPKGYGFSAVLVVNGVSSLAIMVINRVWFLHSHIIWYYFKNRHSVI